MTRASRENPVSQALQLQGRAEELIRRIDTPEKAAEFFVNAQEAYGAAGEVMRHVRGMLTLEARERIIPVGSSFVSAEPSEYTYDVEAVKELAPECIIQGEVATSDKMQRINQIAAAMLERCLSMEGLSLAPGEFGQWAADLVMLSQPEVIEAVDANKLRGILGRGDERAQRLMARRAKTPVKWKLVVREGANANR